MATSLPQVNAFLICESASQQPQTGKWSVLGTYSVVFVPGVPALHAPFTVYICLSDFVGGVTLQCAIRDDETKVVFAMRGEVPKLPMSVVELAFPFPPIRFVRTGSYTLELLAGDDVLSARTFWVKQVPQDPHQGQLSS